MVGLPLMPRCVLKRKRAAMDATVKSYRLGYKIESWFLSVVWMGFIFFFSSLPGSDIPSLFPSQDVLYHSAAYIMLGFLISRAVRGSWPRLHPSTILLIVFMACLMYGMSDEMHQSFVPGRSVSAKDLYVDAMSGFLGGFLHRCLR
jgi:VanZ family protein